MHKGEQIKHKRHPLTRQTIRSPAAQRQERAADRHLQETTSVAYRITIRGEKPRKCSDKLASAREKPPRSKKLKFITEDIEKSNHELLSVRSGSHQRQRSAKLSPHNVEENAYELLRASKRSQQLRKSRSKGEEGALRQVAGGNVKPREKTQSRDRLQLNLRLDGLRERSTKKGKTKSSRKSEREVQPRRFLSPELVKLENSYYFSNYDEQEARPAPATAATAAPMGVGNCLAPPKKESKFIFESNQDFWNDPHGKRLLTSTLDLLN